MWRACRVVALQHLHTRSVASTPARLYARLGRHAHVAQLWDTAAVAPARRHLSSNEPHGPASPRFVLPGVTQPALVAGVALRDLAKRPRRELELMFGARTLRAARAALPQTWDNLLLANDTTDDVDESADAAAEVGGGSPPPVTCELATQIFLAAVKQHLPELALNVFDYLDTAFPMHGDFVVYGEAFTLLARMGDGPRALAVYERNKPLYASADKPAPELFYRFGVLGFLGKGDFAAAEALVDEMQALGLALSNELKSRVMLAYAKSDKREQVREIFETLDPQRGRWHTADVDRVITSMGLIARADDAFAFYRHAQVQLSGHTLVALLHVCRANDRRKHALMILDNRKRFDLDLSVREYNAVLETLEVFDEHAQLVFVLNEMRDRRVKFDKRTREIVTRNQHCLQGTRHELSLAQQQQQGNNTDDAMAQRDVAAVRRELQSLVATKAFAAAAALADAHTSPLANDDESATSATSDALTIPPALAADALVAYARNDEHDKVAALVRGFARVKGDFAHALTSAVSIYSTRDLAIVYAAFKASLFQDRTIFRVSEALARFRDAGDVDATMSLFRQAFARVGAALEANGHDRAALQKTLAFDRSRVVKETLQVLIEQHALANVIEVLDTLDAHGFYVRAGNYTTIFRVMREQHKYKANDFELLWRDMVDRRNVEPTRSIVAHCCVALAGGTVAQQQLALDAYALVRDRADDTYVLPPACYSALLAVAAKRSNLSAVQLLLNDAEQSHAAAKSANNKIRFYPREWTSALVDALARDGDGIDHVDDIVERVVSMKTHCGGYAYDAVVTALRTSALANKHAHIAKLRTIFTRDAKFQLRLNDCERLVRVAAAKHSFALAQLAIELFEDGNVVRGAAAAGEAVKNDATVVPAFELQKPLSARKLKEIAGLYAVALRLSKDADASPSTTVE